MKKVLSLTLVLMLLLGCSAAIAEEKLVGAVVVKAIGSTWFDSMGWETDKRGETIGERGYSLENHYIGPTAQDSAAQLQSLSDALALNPDILCVVPIAADAVDAMLAVAKANGSTIVTHEGGTLQNIDYNVDAFHPDDYGAH